MQLSHLVDYFEELISLKIYTADAWHYICSLMQLSASVEVQHSPFHRQNFPTIFFFLW